MMSQQVPLLFYDLAQCLAAMMEQRDAIDDEDPTNSIGATGTFSGFSSNSAFHPFQKPPPPQYYRSASTTNASSADFSSFPHHHHDVLLGNATSSGTAKAISNNAAMRRFHSFVQQDREEVANPSNLIMEEAPKTLLLRRMSSSFSFPDLDLDFPFTMATTDPCQNHHRDRVVEKQIIQKPQAAPQWLPNNNPGETAVASSNPQQHSSSSSKHHRRQTSGRSQEPSFDNMMQEDTTLSLAGAADERYVVQTVHGPALLLTGKSFCSPSSSISQNNAQSEPSTPNNRKFQRWSEEEDETLLHAISSAEGKSPHNWKRIAKKHFSNSRTGLQCKSRWTKVRTVVECLF
jgi:hypothetical protein